MKDGNFHNFIVWLLLLLLLLRDGWKLHMDEMIYL